MSKDYIIHNKVNNKKYIEQTIQTLSKKQLYYRGPLNNEKYIGKYLQSFWNKYMYKLSLKYDKYRYNPTTSNGKQR